MVSRSVWPLLILAGILQYVLGSDSPPAGAPAEQATLDSQQHQLLLQLQELVRLTGPEPLFLTPYIKNCSYYEARKKSELPYFKTKSINAYSGYITVNETTDSNIFFLLTEQKDNSSSTPLLLWTQGGPGLSALFGLLLENGPLDFNLDPSGDPVISSRLNTLQNNMSVLYVDLPVGAGFSFTNDTVNGYPKNLEEIVDHVKEFLTQFMKVFSEYQGRPLYLAGESYGARYSVAVANYWEQKDIGSSGLNLKGIIGGNGFLGPILYVADSSEFLYQTSMLEMKGYIEFKEQFQKMREYAANETLQPLALKMLLETIFTSNTTPTLFQNLTLYSDHASPLFTHRPFRMLACYVFLNTSMIKALLHAGINNTFQIYNEKLLTTFASDWMRDISTFNELVLNTTNVLLYTGQLDALFPSVNQRNYYKTLNWTHAEKYKRAERCTWTPYSEYYGFAGYMKTVKEEKTFTEVVILDMSHYGAVEKPDVVYFLINQFIANLSDAQSVAVAS